jgi:hypothetical protein
MTTEIFSILNPETLPTPSFWGLFVSAKLTRHADASLIAVARNLLVATLLNRPHQSLLHTVVAALRAAPLLPAALRRALPAAAAATIPLRRRTPQDPQLH